MIYLPFFITIFEILFVALPILFTVACVTIAERKTMASMQRRLGPNIVGYYGLLQAFADALKLLLKEYVSPIQATMGPRALSVKVENFKKHLSKIMKKQLLTSRFEEKSRVNNSLNTSLYNKGPRNKSFRMHITHSIFFIISILIFSSNLNFVISGEIFWMFVQLFINLHINIGSIFIFCVDFIFVIFVIVMINIRPILIILFLYFLSYILSLNFFFKIKRLLTQKFYFLIKALYNNPLSFFLFLFKIFILSLIIKMSIVFFLILI